MLIKEYFEYYKKYKQTEIKLKKFSLIDKKYSIVNFFKKNKKSIINNINYMYFDSDEKYLMQVYSSDEANIVFINTKQSIDIPPIFLNKREYENYLTIFGSFCVLLNQNIQINSINDTRISIFLRDFLKDLTYFIYYCDDFHLNLQNYVDDNFALKSIYKYGYDFLFNVFLAFSNNKIDDKEIISFFETEEFKENSIRDLYNSFLPSIKGF